MQQSLKLLFYPRIKTKYVAKINYENHNYIAISHFIIPYKFK